MPIDPMDDIELRSVQLQFTNGRGSMGGISDLRRVETDKGEVLVAVQGDATKPAILTYHDLGLNCKLFPNSFESNIDLFPVLRCYEFRRFLQLSNDARAAREFLRLSCDCAWPRRRSRTVSRRVIIFIQSIRIVNYEYQY